MEILRKKFKILQKKGVTRLVKVKISYEREEELFRVLRLLEPVIVKWKRSKNQDGRFKKAYAELCGPWKLQANPNEVRGNYGEVRAK